MLYYYYIASTLKQKKTVRGYSEIKQVLGTLRSAVVAQCKEKTHNWQKYLMWAPIDFLCVQAVISWPAGHSLHS